MTIADNLNIIKNSLASIKEAIIGKGQTPTGNITTYADAICNIEVGSNEEIKYKNADPFLDTLFDKNMNANTIVIPNGITIIPIGCFARLPEEYISNLLSSDEYTGDLTINDWAIAKLAQERITNVIIPDSVTSIERLSFAFNNGLTNITIGSGVTSVEMHAFHGCNNLKKVTIKNDEGSIYFADKKPFPDSCVVTYTGSVE